MKLPKKVIIGGKFWKIVTDKKQMGAKFLGGEGIIKIGTKFKGDIPYFFLHEVLEAILSERNHRFEIYGGLDGNENFLFNFDHEALRNISMDLAVALKDVLS